MRRNLLRQLLRPAGRLDAVLHHVPGSGAGEGGGVQGSGSFRGLRLQGSGFRF